nr:PREDICTED: uncharacterized protein LOC100882998 [Megachile rotundata]
MPKISVNGSKTTAKEGKHFYDNEILADFQARQKAILREKESVPADVPKHVGMRTINPKSNVGKYFVEFASVSTIHGLNHLVAPNRHPVEKFLAVLFILGALMCLMLLSSIFWDRYQNNATVIVVDNNPEQFAIPKPSLVICPVPNIEPAKIPSVFQKYGIDNTAEAVEFFTFLANVDYKNMLETPLFDKVSPDKWLSILHDLRKDIPPNILRENDRYEMWVVTERGLCLATRSYNGYFSTMNFWKSNDSSVKIPPIVVDTYDYSADGTQQSFAINSAAIWSLCDPFEVVAYGTPIKLLQRTVVQRSTLSIFEIKTKTNLTHLSVHQRKCKFQADGGLETWPVYTPNMCTIECRMKMIEKYCHCRPHFARPYGIRFTITISENVKEERFTGGAKTCNATQLRCIGGITKHLFLHEYAPHSCGCLPKCTAVFYQITDSEKSEGISGPIETSIVSLEIEFPQAIYNRVPFYGFTDFLTSVGGAAGLFLGASVLSFVEIVYYATFRICCYVGQMKSAQKKDKVILP